MITLEDEPEFADAVDCMVSYFYEAGYDATKYETPEPLLHAQVATIADKYDCASLYKLANTSFARSVRTVDNDGWGSTAGFIYDHTSTEVPAHVELRKIVVAAIIGRHSVLRSALHNETVVELLRSNADLATDLMLGGLHENRTGDASELIFVCDNCHYIHAGSRNCSSIVSPSDLSFGRLCPNCGLGAEISKRYTHKVQKLPAFACPFCDGLHTKAPDEDEPGPEPSVPMPEF